MLQGHIILEYRVFFHRLTALLYSSYQLLDNTLRIFQDELTESMVLLQEATSILRVEPHMREILERKIQELAYQLEMAENDNDAVVLNGNA